MENTAHETRVILFFYRVSYFQPLPFLGTSLKTLKISTSTHIFPGYLPEIAAASRGVLLSTALPTGAGPGLEQPHRGDSRGVHKHLHGVCQSEARLRVGVNVEARVSWR